MNEKKSQLPWWIFGVIAIGTFIASGIFIGIMSVEGMETTDLLKAIGYAIVGLLMFWGAVNKR
jgi:hypothetical protein